MLSATPARVHVIARFDTWITLIALALTGLVTWGTARVFAFSAIHPLDSSPTRSSTPKEAVSSRHSRPLCWLT